MTNLYSKLLNGMSFLCRFHKSYLSELEVTATFSLQGTNQILWENSLRSMTLSPELSECENTVPARCNGDVTHVRWWEFRNCLTFWYSVCTLHFLTSLVVTGSHGLRCYLMVFSCCGQSLYLLLSICPVHMNTMSENAETSIFTHVLGLIRSAGRYFFLIGQNIRDIIMIVNYKSDDNLIPAWQWEMELKHITYPRTSRCPPFRIFSLVHRRWVRLVRKGKEIIWTSGRFSAGDLYGSVRRLSASVTRPLRRYYQSQGSSMEGQSMAREKFTPCWAPASTVCGRPWRASLWSPARALQATETPVTHTPNSEHLVSVIVSFHFSPRLPLCSWRLPLLYGVII